MTKLPWSLEATPDPLEPSVKRYHIEPKIASLYYMTDEGLKNGSFIVAACNMHNQLMEIVALLNRGHLVDAQYKASMVDSAE